jgi:hypothetical protein
VDFKYETGNMSMTDAEIRSAGYTHIRPMPGCGAWAWDLLSIGVCERCGMAIEEPNTITIYGLQKELEGLGLRVIDQELPQVWPLDDGSYGCDHCHDKSICEIECPEEFKGETCKT